MELLNNIISFLRDNTYFNNSLLNYVIALILFVSIILAITLVIKFIIKKIPLEDRVSNAFLSAVIEIFRKRLIYISYALAVYVALKYLTIPEKMTHIIDNAVMVYISVIVVLAITDIIKNMNTESLATTGTNKIPAGILTLLKTFVWIAALLFIFSNLGYNVSTFITGLGIGGIAVALAAQNILGDLFNYIVIIFDKPFIRGDLIQFNSFSGRVEYIGIKSTRIRSSNGEILSVSNTDLTKSVIQNYEMSSKRRNVSIIGVEYETDIELLHKMPELLEQAVKSVSNIEFARVHLSSFNASSIDFELVYYVLSNDYVEYTKGVQAVNFAILDLFAKEGVNFAYPAQRMISK